MVLLLVVIDDAGDGGAGGSGDDDDDAAAGCVMLCWGGGGGEEGSCKLLPAQSADAGVPLESMIRLLLDPLYIEYLKYISRENSLEPPIEHLSPHRSTISFSPAIWSSSFQLHGYAFSGLGCDCILSLTRYGSSESSLTLTLTQLHP